MRTPYIDTELLSQIVLEGLSGVEALKDIAVSPEGQLRIVDGDFVEVSGEDAIEQHIRWRILTPIGSWLVEPACGSRIFDFVGSPLSPETAQELEIAVWEALTHDGFLDMALTRVHVAPIDHDTVAVVIVVGEMESLFQFTLNLPSGEISGWEKRKIDIQDYEFL